MGAPSTKAWAYPNAACAGGLPDARTAARKLLGKATFDHLCRACSDSKQARTNSQVGANGEALRELTGPALRQAQELIEGALKHVGSPIPSFMIDRSGAPRVSFPGLAHPEAKVIATRLRADLESARDALTAVRRGAVELRALHSGTVGPLPREAARSARALSALAQALRPNDHATPTALAYFAIGSYLEPPCEDLREFQSRVAAWKLRLKRARLKSGQRPR